VWARQHGLSAAQTADGLDGHLMAMLMTHLAERGKLVGGVGCLRAHLEVLMVGWADCGGGNGEGDLMLLPWVVIAELLMLFVQL